MFGRKFRAWMDWVAGMVLVPLYSVFLIVAMGISIIQSTPEQNSRGIVDTLVIMAENLGNGLRTSFTSAGGEE